MSSRTTVCGAFVCLAILACTSTITAAEPALWLRYPAISPDGQTIAFSYRGDLWRVPSSGGQATQLTVHAAHDYIPVWSPDGSKIAYASNRYGNHDIFVMAATGGPATRLTYHSAGDYPSSFTPDGGSVLFSSSRLDAQACVQYPTGAQPELYRVSLEGGMPKQVLSTPTMFAVWDAAGERLAYSDQKGYEGMWRKHDNSSFARDVWIYNAAGGQHTRLTDFGADDRSPVWAPGEDALYYLSERDGTFNVWMLAMTAGSQPEKITSHDTHPVRFLSISDEGDLAYGWDGEIYVRRAGSSESRKIQVTIAVDSRHNEVEFIDVARGISDFDLSPDGKEIVFVARGEVFVTSTGHADTKRITNTPEQERSVSFSPDGRSVLYASERNGSWNVYRTELTDDDEPSFFNATAFEENVVVATEAEEFQPAFSPDGKEVAYFEDRVTLKVINIDSGESRTILPAKYNYSYIDGDQWYDWSPDGQWFLVRFLSTNRYSVEVGLVPSSGGGEVVNLTKNGYYDFTPRWVLDGEAMVWFSDRAGDRSEAIWPVTYDVYATFFTQEAWDRYHLTEVELEQEKEREKKKKDKDKGDEEDAEKKDEEEAKDDEKDGEIELPDPVDLNLDGLEDRTIRLTMHTSRLGDARLTPDGEKLLYLARFEKGFNLWVTELRKKETKILAKLDADDAEEIIIDKEGEKAYVLADRSLKSIEISGGKSKPVKLQAKMELDAAAERAYFFEHAWRQTREKFYVEDLHGVDWDLYKEAYARFLPHIDNNYDLAELLSELQGELNASHLGSGYRPRGQSGDATASLGIYPDTSWDGDGIKVAEIIEGGPLENADTKVKAGTVIERIDGAQITAGMNWYPLLNRKTGTPIRLALVDPTSGTRWEETVKPISLREEGGLVYQRWVRSRRAEVDRLSDGRLGYAHIRSMSDRGYRQAFEEIFGRAVAKEGIILDTRFNGGGNLVEPLTTLLSGEVYARMVPRGQQVGIAPRNRWTKPSIVVMNEGNYSDAHCFPAAYTELEIGKTVGMQVPGTCTSVWWETVQDGALYFGIPQIGYLDNDGEMLENQHLDPDYVIDNDPALEAAGRDQQLEKAVEVVLAGIDG
jgi:Tol biopolymer transport system component/C-terminal processing protease CtpA/Prc